jgi:FkbM family methyltransferase
MLNTIRRWINQHKTKSFLKKNFSNAAELTECWTHGLHCDKAVFKDGSVLSHPPNSPGFIGMILEVMCQRVYTGEFYLPSDGDIIIDAGANVGVFSIHAYSLCPTARIIAYEPFPMNFKYLVENLQRFNASSVAARRIAIGKEASCVYIQTHGTRSQDHRIADSNQQGDSAFEVASRSFASLISEFPGEDIALFKCDIEGGEFDLFDGATEDAIRCVKRFAIEFHDNIKPNTSTLLKSKLGTTHHVYTQHVSPHGYGMLYATRKV